MTMRMAIPLVIASIVLISCEKQNKRIIAEPVQPDQGRTGRSLHASPDRPTQQQPKTNSAETKPRSKPEQNRPEPIAGVSPGKSGGSVTPLDQSGAETDIAITQRIRQALLREKDLSFAAKNVLVITESDHVVLKGQVRSSSEAERIKGIAAMVTTKRIEDVLEVSP